MSVMRTISTFLLVASVLAASSAASVNMGPPRPQAKHDCCAKHRSEDSKPRPKQDCDGAACVMQCCRLISVPSTSSNLMVFEAPPLQHGLILPVVLHTLTTPESIFHPPRD